MKYFNSLLATLGCTLLLLSVAMASDWQTLAPGFEYNKTNQNNIIPWCTMHAFRIDLTRYHFDIVTAKKLHQKAITVGDVMHKTPALLAINAGFFDKNHQALGLRVAHSQLLTPLKNISWWGVFAVKNNRASIFGVHHYPQKYQPEFALQSGPRLIIHQKIPKLKSGFAERSALCITNEGKAIIIVTENAAMSTTVLASILRSPPFDCVDAINLDGGSSSQLFARINGFEYHVPGFSQISDALVVLPN